MPRAPQPPPETPAGFGAGSAGPPLSLRAEDFGRPSDAARADLRRRLVAWSGAVTTRLRAFGLELAMTLGDDGELSRACFFALMARGAVADDARAGLVLMVAPDAVRAGLELPVVQLAPVRLRIADPARALALSTALEDLPEQFAVGIDDRDSPRTTARCGVDELREMLNAAARANRPLWIGWSIAHAVAVEHAALLDEQLKDALAALARAYVLLTGDSEEGAVVLRPRRSPRRKRGEADAEAEAEAPRASAPVADSVRARDRNRERGGRPLRDELDREPDAEIRPDAIASIKGGQVAAAEPRAPQTRLRYRPVTSRPRKDTHLERGARVRVLEGPFSGKVGVVQELDGKGGARVMLGLLAVRMDVKNVTAEVEGRYRPVLSTSHRKPMLVRS